MKKSASLISALTVMLVACQLKGATAARTVVVFPFTNLSNRADLSWISESFADILLSRLAAPTRFVLGRDERNAAYAQLELSPGAPLTLASVYKVAEILGVDWAVVGSFNVAGNVLSARTQLMDAHGLKLSPQLEASGALSDLVDLQTQLAWRLLAAYDPEFTVGTLDDFRRRFPDVRLDAFENYIRGILETDEASRVRFLTEADRRDPRDHRAAFHLGLFYFDRKDYAKSAQWLRKLDEKDANFAESLFLLGVDEYFLGHTAPAEKAFAVLAKEIPLNEVANNLGVMETRRQAYEEALPQFERAYQGDPTDPDFAFNLGICLWYLKRYNEASKYLQEAVRIDDEDPGTHSMLRAVLRKTGDSEGQQRERQWLADHEGVALTMPLDQEILPQTRIKKHFDGRAFRLLAVTVQNAVEESLAGLPAAEHAAAHLSNGKTLLAQGRLVEAEHELAEAVSLVPQDSEVHLAMAQVLEAEGKNQEAAAELQTSLKLKNSATGHVLLARAYLSLDRLDAARAESETALSLEPGNADAARLIDQIRQRAPAARRLR